MFNEILNFNFNTQNSQSDDNLFLIDSNPFQSFPSLSSINYFPEIKEEGKKHLKDNNIPKKIKTKNDDNFELKGFNEFFVTNKREKKEKISTDKKKDNLEQLNANNLNEKNNNKKKLGKKRKNINSYEKHTKFSDDNLQRKCITIIINNTLEFVNKRIKEIYNGNIGNGMNCKKLFNVNMYLKPNFSSIDFIKNLLHKTLGEIYSDNISMKYSNYFPNYNILMIKRLLNEKDQDKRMHLKNLFGITFIECIKKFAGVYDSEELKGFKTFNEYKKKLKQDPEYLEALKNYLVNFEENIRRKKTKIKLINNPKVNLK